GKLSDRVSASRSAMGVESAELWQKETHPTSAGDAHKRQDSAHAPLNNVAKQLNEVERFLSRFRTVSQGEVLLLIGDAGSGKTHLLCDLAKNQLHAGGPVVLLLGQRFTSTSTPWVQVAELLHAPGVSGP